MEIAPYRLLSGRYNISYVAFSIDGRYIACVLRKRYIRIVNTFSGIELDRESINLGVSKVRYLAISPDNTKIACITDTVSGIYSEYSFILYSIIDKRIINSHIIDRHVINYALVPPYYRLTYSNDGRYIAVVHAGELYIYYGHNGSVLSVHRANFTRSSLMFFSNDNTDIIFVSRFYNSIWNTIFKRLISRKCVYPSRIILSPDLYHYTVCSRDNISVRMKNALKKDFKFVVDCGRNAWITYSHTGSHLLLQETARLCIRDSNNGDIYFETPLLGSIKSSHMCINNRYITVYTSRGYIHTYDMHGRWTPSRYLLFSESHRKLSLYTWMLAQKLQAERTDLPILPTEIWILVISMYWYTDVLL